MKTYADILAIWFVNIFVQVFPANVPLIALGEIILIWLSIFYTAIRITLYFKKLIADKYLRREEVECLFNEKFKPLHEKIDSAAIDVKQIADMIRKKTERKKR